MVATMHSIQLVLCTFCVLISAAIGHVPEPDGARYANYRLIEFTPMGPAQRRIFEDLRHRGQGHIFLRTSRREHVPWLMAVPPHTMPAFQQYLTEMRSYRIIDSDLQSAIRSGDQQKHLHPRLVDWKSYQTLSSINTWMRHMEHRYPHQVHAIEVGTSYENRTIRGVRIAHGIPNGTEQSPGSDKPGVFIECGAHAREWISPAFCTYVINQLLTSNDSAVRQVAESHDWYIVPVVNPDGYVYTQQDRLWRKTRSPALPSFPPECRGADPNRNWDIEWNKVGPTHQNQCSEEFRGSKPFSEVEIRTLAAYLRGLGGKLRVYLSIHSFSQLIVYPYGYTDQAAKMKMQLEAVGQEAAHALSQRYGTEYDVGPIETMVYPVGGCSVDYAYDKLDIPLSYAYELRPKHAPAGTIGFDLPAAQIIDVGEETLDSVVAMLNAAKLMGFN